MYDFYCGLKSTKATACTLFPQTNTNEYIYILYIPIFDIIKQIFD